MSVALAKSLARLQGGKLTACSDGLGKGCVFALELTLDLARKGAIGMPDMDGYELMTCLAIKKIDTSVVKVIPRADDHELLLLNWFD